MCVRFFFLPTYTYTYTYTYGKRVCMVGWVGVGVYSWVGWCGDAYLDGEFDEGHTHDDVTYITTAKVTYSYLDGEFDEGHGNRVFHDCMAV